MYRFFTQLATPQKQPNDTPDVPLDFDFGRVPQPQPQPEHITPIRPLTTEVSVNDPCYDWSKRVSNSNTGTARPTGQSAAPLTIYTCVSDLHFGVQFRPITPIESTRQTIPLVPPIPQSITPVAPVPHTPQRRPLSFGLNLSTTSASDASFSTARSTSSLSSSTAFTSCSSSTSSVAPASTNESYASCASSAPSFATPIVPYRSRRSSGSASILGQPNGLLPSNFIAGQATQSQARPLFHPETPPSFEKAVSPNGTPRYPISPPSTSQINKKQKGLGSEDAPLKYRRCATTKVNTRSELSLSSDSEEYEGVRLRDTGYQSADGKGKKSLIPLTVGPKAKGRLEAGEDRRGIRKDWTIGTDAQDAWGELENLGEDENNKADLGGFVKVEKEPGKVTSRPRPIPKYAIKSTPLRVPFGTTWFGPRSGLLKLNAKGKRPEGWVNGLNNWTYSAERPALAAANDRMPGDIHFSTFGRSPDEEEEPFSYWVVKSGSKGVRWVEFAAGQSHPELSDMVLQGGQLPKSAPRWVKGATYRAKF